MGSTQSSHSNIRLECILNNKFDSKRKRKNDIVLQDASPGEILQGVVRLQVPRRVKNLDKYEGIVLTLTGREVWMVDGKPLRLRANSRSSSLRQQSLFQDQDPYDLRHVMVEKMITDFEFTPVGDGIDFRFPYAIEVPGLLSEESRQEGDEDNIMPGLALSSRSIPSNLSASGDGAPEKEIVYQLTASLKKKRTSPSARLEPPVLHSAEQTNVTVVSSC